MTIGTLTRVPLREVWKHEAHDFTTWLEANTDVLSEVLDVTLVSAEREKSAGDFNVDLVGETEDGQTVVIENQLEKSDHDHLGKVLTYLAAFDASAAVWIVARPRQEHIKAVTWLNEATATPFYLVQVEAVRIGDSAPAPLFTRIVGPSAEAQARGVTKRQFTVRHQVRHRFWSQLLDVAKDRTKLHSNVSPSKDSWIGAGSGLGGVGFNYVVIKHAVRIELYIDRGDEALNKALFEQLHAHADAVHSAMGADLDWQRLEGKRACRIAYKLEGGGWRDEAGWPGVIDAAVDAMVRFEKALKPFIKKLKIEVP